MTFYDLPWPSMTFSDLVTRRCCDAPQSCGHSRPRQRLARRRFCWTSDVDDDALRRLAATPAHRAAAAAAPPPTEPAARPSTNAPRLSIATPVPTSVSTSGAVGPVSAGQPPSSTPFASPPTATAGDAAATADGAAAARCCTPGSRASQRPAKCFTSACSPPISLIPFLLPPAHTFSHLPTPSHALSHLPFSRLLACSPPPLQEYDDGSHAWDGRLVLPLAAASTFSWVVTGMRWPLPVPQHAIVVASFISLVCATPSDATAAAFSGGGGSDDSPRIEIGVELTDDAAPFPYYDGEFGPSAYVLAARAMLAEREMWEDAACTPGEVHA